MNSVDQLLLAGYAQSSEHRTRHLAELILDQIQPRTVFWCEDKNESLGHGLQVTARLFGDMCGMVVKYRLNVLYLRIGVVQFLYECDEIATVVHVTNDLCHSYGVQIQAAQ